MLKPGAAIEHVIDPAATVRDAALSNALETASDAHVVACVDKLLNSERVDTLSAAISRSKVARHHAATALAVEDIAPRVALVLLEAFAHDQRA
jgi:hypothetical protein